MSSAAKSICDSEYKQGLAEIIGPVASLPIGRHTHITNVWKQLEHHYIETIAMGDPHIFVQCENLHSHKLQYKTLDLN